MSQRVGVTWKCVFLTLEPLLQIGISSDMLWAGQDLDGDRPLQPGVGRFIDFTHAPGPDGGVDLIRVEAGAALEGHI